MDYNVGFCGFSKRTHFSFPVMCVVSGFVERLGLLPSFSVVSLQFSHQPLPHDGAPLRPGSASAPRSSADAFRHQCTAPSAPHLSAPPSKFIPKTAAFWFLLFTPSVCVCLLVVRFLQLARPMCMVPNIPGIPGPPLGGSSSGSNSPSGYSISSEAKMVGIGSSLYF